MTISFTFYPWNDVDPSQAQIYTTLTVNQSAFTQQLITQSTANPDGSYTASAQTSHLSPFGVYVPIDVTLTPKAYFPLTANNSPGPGW